MGLAYRVKRGSTKRIFAEWVEPSEGADDSDFMTCEWKDGMRREVVQLTYGKWKGKGVTEDKAPSKASKGTAPKDTVSTDKEPTAKKRKDAEPKAEEPKAKQPKPKEPKEPKTKEPNEPKTEENPTDDTLPDKFKEVLPDGTEVEVALKWNRQKGCRHNHLVCILVAGKQLMQMDLIYFETTAAGIAWANKLAKKRAKDDSITKEHATGIKLEFMAKNVDLYNKRLEDPAWNNKLNDAPTHPDGTDGDAAEQTAPENAVVPHDEAVHAEPPPHETCSQLDKGGAMMSYVTPPHGTRLRVNGTRGNDQTSETEPSAPTSERTAEIQTSTGEPIAEPQPTPTGKPVTEAQPTDEKKPSGRIAMPPKFAMEDSDPES